MGSTPINTNLGLRSPKYFNASCGTEDACSFFFQEKAKVEGSVTVGDYAYFWQDDKHKMGSTPIALLTD